MSRSEDLAPLVVAAASAAAGRMDNKWRSRVMELIPPIAAAMSESSREMKAALEVLEASVFTATFVGFEVEASSTRCLVRLDTGRPSKNYPDGIEPIRSHRTDNPQGKAMQQKLERLKPGDRVLVWRAMDEIADGQKARLLAHIQYLGGSDPKSEPLRHQPGTGHESEVRQAPAGEARRAPAGDDVALAVQSFEELAPRTKAAAAKALREAGLSFPEPKPDETERWLKIIGEVTGT